MSVHVFLVDKYESTPLIPQSLASFTVGGGGEGPLPELDDMLAGGVAVEDLEHEERDRGDGVERAIAPGIARVAAGVSDGLGRGCANGFWHRS